MLGPPTIYLETTVISYLTARLSRNLRVVAHQEITADWWTRRRTRFDLYVSRLVIDEAGGLTMVDPNDAHDDLPDEIVEDIRAARRVHAAAFGFDVVRIVADLRKKDAVSGDSLVSLPPKPARHRRVAAGE